MPIVWYIYRVLLRGDVFQLAFFYQFTEDTASGRLHLQAEDLELPTGDDGLLCEMLRQFHVDLLLSHRHGVGLEARTLDFLFFKSLFQIIVCAEGN